MTTSAIYFGRVTHARSGAVSHRLAYRVWYLLVDIDELDALDRALPLFASERPGVVSFHRADHGPRDGGALRPWIEGWLAHAGIDIEGGPIRILTMPRIWGYTFNPLSVWYCHHADGSLRAILYEVSNTFGERHSYLVPVDASAGDGPISRSFAKELFVSPFIGMDAMYRFRTWVPQERARIVVHESTGEGHLLTATLTAHRAPLSTRTLMRGLLAYPLLTLKVIGGIHWEAFRLWRKGAPYRRRGAPPTHEVTIVAGPARSRAA
jgi:hypothetical protein